MSLSILVVDDEPDVGELFRQRFRRETRDGTYVMHFAESAAEALDSLTKAAGPDLPIAVDGRMPESSFDRRSCNQGPDHMSAPGTKRRFGALGRRSAMA